MEDMDIDVLYEADEVPKNLLSDLDVDSRGWIRSNSQGIDDLDDSSNSTGPVLFSSCVKLLEMLKLNIDDVGTETGSESGKETETEAEAATEVKDENDEKDIDDITPELPFVENVVDKIISALSQVMKMSSAKTKKARFQRKKFVYESTSAGNSEKSEGGNGNRQSDSDWVDIRGKTTKEIPYNDNDEEYFVEASERTQVTFNTLDVLLSILIPMVNHPKRRDFGLVMKNGPSIKQAGKKHLKKSVKIEGNIMEPSGGKRGKKSQAYLIFSNAYSIVSDKQLQGIEDDVEHIRTIAVDLHAKVTGVPATSAGTSISSSSTVLDHSKKGSIPMIFKGPNISIENIIERTLPTLLDSDIEEFAHRVDKTIINPLSEDKDGMHRLHRDSVKNLRNRLTQILTSKFRGARLELYGSCLSGLSLGNSSDVDISLYIPAACDLQHKYLNGDIDRQSFQRKMKKFVYKVHDALALRGGNRNQRSTIVEFGDLEAVPYARVPVVKGRYLHANNPFSSDGSMHFDICILNDIAVVNSGLLREYSLLDQRVRMLMLSVKSWVKWKDIGSAADGTLSSYTWMIMCIYYLQCIGFLPTLQCPKLMKAHELKFDPENRMHTVNGLCTVYLNSEIVMNRGIWQQPDYFKTTPVSGLLSGFFLFYAHHFPQETAAVSIRLGNIDLQKTVFRSSRLWKLVVEDPFETHDSSCPHDLGTPMSDIGNVRVKDALEEAAKKMGKMFIDCEEIENCIGSHLFVDNLEGPEFKNGMKNKKGARPNQRQRYGGRNGTNNRNARNRARKGEDGANTITKKAFGPGKKGHGPGGKSGSKNTSTDSTPSKQNNQAPVGDKNSQTSRPAALEKKDQRRRRNKNKDPHKNAKKKGNQNGDGGSK